MSKVRETVVSQTAPRKDDLWIHDNKLHYYSNEGWKSLSVGLFDAGFLYEAATAILPKNKVITKEQLEALNQAVIDKDIIYLHVKVNDEFSFKVMVVFTGYNTTSKEMTFSASDFYNHYKIIVNTETGSVSMEQSSVGPTVTALDDGPATYVFNVTDDPAEKRLNKQLAADILFNRVEAVRIKGILNGVTYDTIGVYNDGYITALQKNEYIVFNVSFEDGSITAETVTKVDEALPYAALKVGNTEEIMQYNIEHLPSGEFFVHLEYGYGIGTFQAGEGGFAHITNAYGNEAFFNINVDGSIMLDRDYIKPNEPYTIILKADEIGKILDEVTASQVSKAGEVIVHGTAGPITYTRTADSNERMAYFTDDRKDGQVDLLTYNSSNKMLTHAPVPMVAATLDKVGGVKKAKAVTNADDVTYIATLNALMRSLRDAGILEEK